MIKGQNDHRISSIFGHLRNLWAEMVPTARCCAFIAGLAVLMVVPGSVYATEKDGWVKSARDFHKALTDAGLSSELWTVPGIGHNIKSLYAEKGEAVALFQDKAFKRTLKEQGDASFRRK